MLSIHVATQATLRVPSTKASFMPTRPAYVPMRSHQFALNLRIGFNNYPDHNDSQEDGNADQSAHKFCVVEDGSLNPVNL